MATITSDTFLDDGTARTAGESWTMNGGILTVRTDTRVHANAPASMTGTFSNVTISTTLGGGLLLDGRNVRWLAFSSGAGTVPAIGTNITQGGVSGYFLGVWPDLTSAPLATGAAMPSTGFIKFREVTSGPFSAGALSGISANADGPDTVGWIEVVMDQATAITVPRLGFFRTRGDWFELGTTTGTAGQIVQVPTNGGGANTFVPGVWIETGPSTNQYEFYPALLTADFSTTNLSLDQRSKFVNGIGNGQLRIGNNGTVNIGFLPPSGCRIRIPNVIGRQCTTAARATNAAPNATLATRPDFTTTSAGSIDVEFFIDDWYHLFSTAYGIRFVNSATFDVHQSSNEASPMVLENYHCGMYNGNLATLTLSNSPLGGTITNCKFFRVTAASNAHSMNITAVSNLTMSDVHTGVIAYTRSSGRCPLLSTCFDITLNDFYTYNGSFDIATCSNIYINDFDYCDRFTGNTNSTSGINSFEIRANCDNVVIDGFTFGLKGLITANFCNPYGQLFNIVTSRNIIARNGGTAASPLPVASAATGPGAIFSDGGVNDGIKIQNINLQFTRTNIATFVNTSTNILLENLRGTVGPFAIASLNTQTKNIRTASFTTTGQASVYGSSFFNVFTGDTIGFIIFAMNEPTSFDASTVTLQLTPGSKGGFTSGGQVVLPSVGDRLIMESPYYIIGNTGLANVAPTLTGTNTGNMSYEYDIDTGSGFSNVYKTFNAANLSAETIDPVNGFKIRLRITTTVANASNALTYVRAQTVTTLADQQNNLYPQETANPTFQFTGLDNGTEVVLFNSSNVELDREVISGTTYSYSYIWRNDVGDINDCYALIWKDDKTPIKFTNIDLGNQSQSIPITQTADNVYSSSASISTFIPGSKLQVLNTGVVTAPVNKLYSDWKDWVRVSNNSQYDFAYSQLGGDLVSGAIFVPSYAFLLNGWKIRPQEANHTLTVTDGILVATGDPFVNPTGAFTVRINYQQPVQALAVSTSGGSGATVAEIRAELETELSLIRNNVPLIPAGL